MQLPVHCTTLQIRDSYNNHFLGPFEEVLTLPSFFFFFYYYQREIIAREQMSVDLIWREGGREGGIDSISICSGNFSKKLLKE
jgi:hypothetical protein